MSRMTSLQKELELMKTKSCFDQVQCQKQPDTEVETNHERKSSEANSKRSMKGANIKRELFKLFQLAAMRERLIKLLTNISTQSMVN